jgi:hypothetical protein
METPTFLYKPNFCAECGEKIERENWHFWNSRRFCDDCEPVYRMTRIVPLALFGAVILFAGIFLGNSGQRYVQTPLKETQSSLVEKKSPPPKPQALAAKPAANAENSNVLVNPTPEPAPAESNTINAAPKPVIQSNTHVEPRPEVVYTCGARTQKGTPCSRRVKEPGRCWQHMGKPSMLEAPKN